MQRCRLSGLLLLAALAALPGTALASTGPSGHSHDRSFSAGEPGDAKQPARIVQVIMREADGKMMYVPNRLEIRRGEQVRFLLRNIGTLEHEFVLASPQENLKHAALMEKYPDMQHEEPNARSVAPEKTDELLWRFTTEGTFEYGCLIPGHRQAGMIGTIVVR